MLFVRLYFVQCTCTMHITQNPKQSVIPNYFGIYILVLVEEQYNLPQHSTAVPACTQTAMLRTCPVPLEASLKPGRVTHNVEILLPRSTGSVAQYFFRYLCAFPALGALRQLAARVRLFMGSRVWCVAPFSCIGEGLGFDFPCRGAPLFMTA